MYVRHPCTKAIHSSSGDDTENLDPLFRATGRDVHGGYAEYAVVREDFAYRIPDTLDAVAATPLLCAGIIGYRSLKQSGLRPGSRLALYGFGAAAHIAQPTEDAEGVAALIRQRFLCAVDIAFITIWAEYNGPLLHSQCYISGALYIIR